MKQMFNKVINYFKKYFLKYTLHKKLDEPIIVKYTNDSDKTKDAILFGNNFFDEDSNFGNESLIVEYLTENYNPTKIRKLLRKDKPTFIIKFIRIMFDEKDRNFYLTNKIVKNDFDLNGKQFMIPVIPLNCIDTYQSIGNIVDISKFKFKKIDGNSYFTFNIEKKSFLVVTLFLYEEIIVSYFKRKKILKQQEKKNRKKAIVVNMIMPKFSIISYIKSIISNKWKTK